jgi:cysteinyl-tRNA synthetase
MQVPAAAFAILLIAIGSGGATRADVLDQPRSSAEKAGANEITGRAAPGLAAQSVKRWHYQLQDIDPKAIANSPTDMVVIDAVGEDGFFGRDQVEVMRRKPDGSRRVMLSYMSIGEAESYRWYWPQRRAEWLGPENPRWRGNYAVRFWHPQWQAIIFDYADRIAAADFDGVYLDGIDMFEQMGRVDEMVQFIERISQRMKARRSDFLVIAQNGDALIADQRFRRAIDGFAREDLFYGEDANGKRNDAESIGTSLARLRMIAAEGKPVFVIEYPRDQEQAKRVARELDQHNFIGLLATRALDRPETAPAGGRASPSRPGKQK